MVRSPRSTYWWLRWTTDASLVMFAGYWTTSLLWPEFVRSQPFVRGPLLAGTVLLVFGAGAVAAADALLSKRLSKEERGHWLTRIFLFGPWGAARYFAWRARRAARPG